MSNLPVPAKPTGGIVIRTTNGQAVTVNRAAIMGAIKPPEPYVPQEFFKGWTLVAGQANDPRLPSAYQKLYMYKYVYQPDGTSKLETVILGPETVVYPIGCNATRSMLPPTPYVRGVNRPPVCKSSDFFNPDQTIRLGDGSYKAIRGKMIDGGGGIIADQCATLEIIPPENEGDPEQYKVVDLCPLCQFRPLTDDDGKQLKDPVTGKKKWIKPLCSKSYDIAAVIPVQKDGVTFWEPVEIHFRSTAERTGLALYFQVMGLAAGGISPWTYPLKLNWTMSGAGGVIGAALDMENPRVFEDDTQATIAHYAELYTQAADGRLKAAQETLEEKLARIQAGESRTQTTVAAPSGGAVIDVDPVAPVETEKAPAKGKGKKATDSEMI